VYADNWQAIQLFLNCSTQWRSGGIGGLIGLDYNAVNLILTLHHQQDNPDIFKQLQIMEQAVLKELNKNY
jgi:hypothetical protein